MKSKLSLHLNVSVIAPAAIIFTLLSMSCFSATIHVPQDYGSIQTAIDAAVTNDEIIVTTGTYYENINFKGKDIILRSIDPGDPDVVEKTVIDGQNLKSVVKFLGTESQLCELSGFTITKGKDQYGGGINGNGTQAKIQNNIITNNEAGGTGGGLHECDGIILNNTIIGNRAPSGGGLSFCQGTIQNNTVSGNLSYEVVINEYGESFGGSGGGFYCCNGTIENNTITNNKSEDSGYVQEICRGGGLSNCSGTIQNNTIAGNTAKDGGGLHNCNGIIENNTIKDNYASLRGGGIQSYTATIKNNIITGNTAEYFGGGISGGTGVIQNNLIYMNSAKYGGGFELYNGNLRNNTICNNTATTSGGGVYYRNSVTIRNCIIWGNVSEGDTPQLDNSTTPSYSCIEDWMGGGEGNISSDPMFRLPEKSDFHLNENSPCIDAGCFISDLTTDLEGDARGYDGTPEIRGDGSDYDIGADEYIGILSIPEVILYPPTELSSPAGNFCIPFALLDPDSEPTSVYVKFSLDGGLTYNWAYDAVDPALNRLNLSSSPWGVHHCFWWFAQRQAPCDDYPQVRIKMCPYNSKGYGQWNATDDFGVDNLFQNPWVRIYEPEETSQAFIPIYYKLIDCQNDPTSLYMKYSKDNGLTWDWAWEAPGGEGTEDLASSPEGFLHRHVWNAAANLGPGSHSNVKISMWVFNTKGGTGFWKSSPFTVHNACGPWVKIYLPSLPFTGNQMPVTVNVCDFQSLPTSIRCQYSNDEGLTWNDATSSLGGTGMTDLPSSPLGIKTVYWWDALSDLGMGSFQVIFSVQPYNPPHGDGGWKQTISFRINIE